MSMLILPPPPQVPVLVTFRPARAPSESGTYIAAAIAQTAREQDTVRPAK